ncbi:putative fructokinase [Paenibacillus sp. J22TS3]|nr:putative fructokinase [Paenibacillus sp. J22TS3]
MRIGAIEAGGTKFICGIGNEQGIIEERVSFPTEHPERTIGNVLNYFKDKSIDAMGIGSFGPLNLDKNSHHYGYVTTTPMPGWENYPFLRILSKVFDIPFGWDTDVNAAAYGEATWGAAQGLDSCVNYTVGTGVGIGIYSEGNLVHGLVHLEGGHVLTRRHPADDFFTGTCPYHGDCLEGMAAGPAIEERWKVKGSELPDVHPAWEMEAFYIGQSVSNTILMLSPQKVILGGGVMIRSNCSP